MAFSETRGGCIRSTLLASLEVITMLRYGNCVKRITAVSTQKLQADAGESFLITGLYAAPESGNSYLTLKVDRKTVGCYRIAGKAGNHLDVIKEDKVHKNLMEYLTSVGINCSIPVAEGQSFTVSAAGTSPTVVVVYEIHDAGDIRADMPNGTESKEYLFMQYMASSGTVDSNETVELDTSLSPAEFPDFPCGKSVPSNNEIEMLGLVGCPCGQGTSASNKTYSTYVKMVKERETLFDEDRNGIPFFYAHGIFGGTNYYSDFSLIGPCVNVDMSTLMGSLGDPMLFRPSLIFRPGEELIMSMSFIQLASYTVAGSDIDLAAIMKVKVS